MTRNCDTHKVTALANFRMGVVGMSAGGGLIVVKRDLVLHTPEGRNGSRSGSAVSTRRSFLERVAILGLIGGLPFVRCKSATARPLNSKSIDSALLSDDASRQSVAADWGSHIKRVPMAVLRPKSTSEIARLVTYANRARIKTAMRGQGHSAYGQAQVEGGIVIDSTALNRVRFSGRDSIDAQPGALWGDVAVATLAQGLIPPVMVDAMMLSVGGTLSVGGIGETSYRFGAQVDNVLELDVVTGRGEMLTCSPRRNSELFHMTLAGLGQCGIIVRARLRLVRAPTFVLMHTLHYDDLGTFLTDQARLTGAATLGTLNGQIVRDKDRRASFVLFAGSFSAQADEPMPTPWKSNLHYSSEEPLTVTPYLDYLNRRTAGVTALKKSKIANVPLLANLPEDAVGPFLRHVLSSDKAYAGISLFEVAPRVVARHRQPLQKMPRRDLLAFELRMQRRASTNDGSDYETLDAENSALVARVYAAGGKIYPPFAPVLSKERWREHYGPEIWRRFLAAKRRFDPNGILTPGAGIF